jgi:uncharacterized protein (TIGR03435 family)
MATPSRPRRTDIRRHLPELTKTIPQFLAFVMNTFQDKQLVDETGLTGVYDITLRLAGLAQGPVSSDDEGTALVLGAQHAGSKFVSKKSPLPVVIIDHIDPPTPNRPRPTRASLPQKSHPLSLTKSPAPHLNYFHVRNHRLHRS